MASTYPTTQDTFTTKANGGVISEDHINDLQNAVIAVEANVGTTNSAVATTIDYKLKNASSVNPGHKHTLAGALTDVEITSPLDGQGIVYETASGKFKNQTTSIADATTAVKGINLMSVAPVSAASPIAVGDNDPRVPTQNENDALVGTSGTAVSSSNKLVDNADTATSGANKVLRLDGTGKLPAVDGSQLTGIPTTLQQAIMPFVYTSLLYTPWQIASLPSGSSTYLYGSGTLAAQQPTLNTYTLSAGLFKRTNTVITTGFTSGTNLGVCPLGSYVYVSGGASGSPAVKRYDAVTLANETTMTVSGATNVGTTIFSDGTFIYLDTGGGTGAFGKFSLSGTTLTFVSTVTFTSFTGQRGMWSDGTYVYNNLGSASGGDSFTRYPIAGGAGTTVRHNQGGLGGSTCNSTGVFKVTGFTNYSVGFTSSSGAQYALDIAIS